MFDFEDMDREKLCQIQERWLPIKETMKIEDPRGKLMAVVKKALITPLRDKQDVKIKGGLDLDVQGNIFDNEKMQQSQLLLREHTG